MAIDNHRRAYRWMLNALVCVVTVTALSTHALSAQETESTGEAQPADPQPPVEEPQTDESALATPDKVNVEQIVGDDAIKARLQRILVATEWFENPQVQVEDGIVFLAGSTQDEKYREWAGKVAGNTQDVVAVVNRVNVATPSIWDMSPMWVVLKDLTRTTVQSIPLLIIAVLILGITGILLKLTVLIADKSVLKSVDNNLLREVARKALAVPVAMLGLYLVLKVSGMTRLAMTVLGGTGLVGLVIGFAFRDIAENFLASILLSVQNPFRYGDLIEVAGYEGYVQRVNTRGTLLMTMEGNHVQIPNSTIYKETIKNYSANPNCRFDFGIGIGYDVPITRAQEAAMNILTDHPAVLNDPEPQVLVEKLGAATVNLRVFAWVNVQKHSWIKVRSSLIRLVKSGFESQGFEMPDEQREVIFPNGVPILGAVSVPQDDEQRALPDSSGNGQPQRLVATDSEQLTNSAEGELASEEETVRQQARQSRDPEDGSTDLLETQANASPPNP
ncbi:Small-conductance mechanosensitive channel [Symmachiella macrocystis]|uniref:Small-conductance mechanosensitive channel n=1 Tax=Symmachiella macrocystis TaxID=2527985 RepID=A0A5C6BQN8_9PLAN|nr:mechanosensitive ion channel family protein [Symmachiella macrocystis]TWU14335.1 Small-conductance mechanosensitive channel [Symmachiella macrocystis]